MSYRNRTLSEKKRIYKKLGLVIAAILVVCIALAIDRQKEMHHTMHRAHRRLKA
jgi:hypothetical protein